MKNCDYYRERISCLVDNELSIDERAEVMDHIRTCPECEKLYEAFCAVSASVEADMEEPPEYIARGVMREIRSTVTRQKRKTRIKWLSAAACVALVVLVGAKLIFPSLIKDYNETNKGTVSNEQMASMSDMAGDFTINDAAGIVVKGGEGGWSSVKTPEEADYELRMKDIAASSAFCVSKTDDLYLIKDSEAIDNLKSLLSPVYGSKLYPDDETNYNLCFDCEDMYVVAELHIEQKHVFVDLGDGAYLAKGSPEEVLAIIKG